MLKDKNHNAVFNELREITHHWHLVSLEGARGAESGFLKEKLLSNTVPEKNISCYSTVAEALDSIRDLVNTRDRILVTGSFLTVGAAIQHLKIQL